jgi:hypothetical protein
MRPKGKKSRNLARKLWTAVKGHADVHLRTVSGEQAVDLPKPGEHWIFESDRADFTTLDRVPIVESAPRWRTLEHHNGFSVYAKVVRPGDHVILERSATGFARLWKGTRESVEGNDAQVRAAGTHKLLLAALVAGLAAAVCISIAVLKRRRR